MRRARTGTFCYLLVTSLQLATPLEESIQVERRILYLRLAPKAFAADGECDTLSPADLEVRVGRQRASVTHLERAPRFARTWLVIDTSESSEAAASAIRRAATRYVRELMTSGEDEAVLLTVDQDLVLVEGPTSDPARLARAIGGMPRGSASALRDGLDEVIRQAAGDGREHLVLYWTDGHDTLSRLGTEDLLETIRGAPNVRVVPMAFLPSAGSGSRMIPMGTLVFDAARASGGEVFGVGERQWIEGVRGLVGRRWVVTIEPPDRGAEEAVEIILPQRRCKAIVLPDPLADMPGPSAGPPSSWIALHQTTGRRLDDPTCASPLGSEASRRGRQRSGDGPWNEPLRRVGGGLAGCALDIVAERGVVYAPGTRYHADLGPISDLGLRAFAVPVPEIGALPTRPEGVLERLLAHPATTAPEGDPDAPGGTRLGPFFLHGRTLLHERGRIARALYECLPEYREFARRRLAREADREQARLRLELQRSFPNLRADEIAAAAAQSRLGRRVLRSVETPADADLRDVLGAWLGDIPARELFLRWEADLIRRRLDGSPSVTSEETWGRARALFALPTHARILAPLVLVRDPERDVIGFWRVVLPRPVGMVLRAASGGSLDVAPYDLVPEQPLGLRLVKHVLEERPEIVALIHEHALRAESVAYEPAGKLRGEDPAHPYREARVRVALRPTEGSGSAAGLVLTADASLSESGVVRVAHLAVAADP